MKLAICVVAILCLALATGCAEAEKAPQEAIAQAESPSVAAPQVEPEQGEAIAAPPPASARKEEPAVEVLPPPAEVRTQAPVAKAITPPANAPAKAATSPVIVKEPRKVEAAAAMTKAPEPTLDLAGLTARLRDTNAVGVLTKLALKNQVDDLLKQFRAHHQGTQKSGLASLRPPYDMLVLKVLAVVQDGDPSLARALSGSREAIWGVLADREKFKLIT